MRIRLSFWLAERRCRPGRSRVATAVQMVVRLSSALRAKDGADAFVDEGPGDVGLGRPGADGGGEDEKVFAVAEFFVHLQGAEDAVVEARLFGVAGGETGALDKGGEAALEIDVDRAEGDGEARGG